MKNVAADTTEIRGITKGYYKWLYANELDDLEETDQFLKIYNILRLNQEET